MKISDNLEYNFLEYKLVQGQTTRFWLGVKQSDPPSDGKWYWMSNYGEEEGNTTNKSQREIKAEANWHPLRDESFKSSCAAQDGSYWSTFPCSDLSHDINFICETPVKDASFSHNNSSSIDMGPVTCLNKENDSCYSTSKQSASWYSARDKCRSIGGFLIKIDGPKENAFLSNRKEHFWTGGNYITGVWRWNEDEDILREDNPGFTDFYSFYKKKRNNTCLGFVRDYYNNNRHHWSGDDCFKWKKFVCELPNVNENGARINKKGPRISTRSADSFVSLPSCLENNVSNQTANGLVEVSTAKCFRFVQSQMSQNESQQFCKEQLSASLADFWTLKKNEKYFLGEIKEYHKEGIWRTSPFMPKWPLAPDPQLEFRNASGEQAPAGHGYVYRRGDPICYRQGDNWIHVVCREFGLDGPYARFPKMDLPYPFDSVAKIHFFDCTGKEKKIRDCPQKDSPDYHLRAECKNMHVNCEGKRRTNERDGFERDGFKIEKKSLLTPTFIAEPAWFVCQDPDASVRSPYS